MTLHQQIQNISRDKPSVFLDKNTLSSNLLKTLSRAIFDVFTGAVKISPDNEYGAFVSGVKIGSKKDPLDKNDVNLDKIVLHQGTNSDEVILEFSKALRINVDIGFVDEKKPRPVNDHEDVYDFNDKFSSATLLIKSLAFRLQVGSDSIQSTSGAATAVVSFKTEGDATLERISQKRGVTIQDLHRIEGVVGSGVQTMFAHLLKDQHKISFVDLYPGLQMNGRIAPVVDYSQEYLILIPAQGITFDPGGTQGCNGIGDGMGDFTNGSSNKPPQDTQGGTITIGGVSSAKPGTSLGKRNRGIGEMGIYLPRSTAQQIAPTVIPGFRVQVGGGGVLDWRAEAFVGFSSINLRFNPHVGAIEADIDFTLDASGRLEADLGKILGRHTIASFSIEQNNNNHIGVAFFPKITDGKIVIKPIIRPGTRISPFDVNVNLGKFFGMLFGSVGSVIGFVFDVVLANLVERKLPGKLREEINSALSKSAWTLIDIREWLALIGEEDRSYVQYDTLSDSILVSVKNNGEGQDQTVGGVYEYSEKVSDFLDELDGHSFKPFADSDCPD